MLNLVRLIIFPVRRLTLVRNGGASAEDVYSATANLAALTESGNLVLSGVTIGTVTTNSAGTLVLTFNANATQARVNETLQSIAYTNSSGTPPASVQIDWSFDDGNTGAQGTGGALSAAGNTLVNILTTTFVVNTTADTADANPGNGVAEDGVGDTSLRAAIEEANALAGADNISIGAGTFMLSGGEITISSDVTITGTGVNQTFIDADSLSRIFHITSGTVTISDLAILNGNASGMLGGAILNDGALVLNNVSLVDNDAKEGGAIASSASSSLTVNGGSMTGNTAENGGAIWIKDTVAGLTLTDVSLSGNSATTLGGAIFSETGPMQIDGSSISGNTAHEGGGIYSKGDVATLTNVTISGNSATTLGGGINNNAGNLNATNVTITDNSAATGSGIHRSGGTVSMQNSIVAGNLGSADVSGSYTSLGYNLIGNGDGSSGFTDGVNGDQVGTGGSPIDPVLGALADNGGPTLSHALLAGSTAIDGGTNTGAPATDQRGETRDASVDIGAYEYEVPATILDQFNTTDFNGNDGSVSWTGDWQELGESDGASSGNVSVVSSPAALRIGSTGLINGDGAMRQADLSTATSAILSMDVWVSASRAASVTLAVSDDGGSSWTNLQTWVFSSLTTSPALQTFDISAYTAANTQIRLLGAGEADSADFYADNIQIEYTTAAVNVAPTDITLSNSTVNENVNTTGGYSVGSLTSTDADGGETFTYSIIAGADSANFSIGGASSDELIIDDGVLNFENKNTYQVTVRTTDSASNTYDELLTITVNDIAGNISGVAYIDEGVTNIGAGKTISMVVNGSLVESVVTGAGGVYSFTEEAGAGDAVVVFIDNDATYQGTTFTVSDGSDLSGIQVFSDHITVRNDNGGATSNADINTALGGFSDPEIHVAVIAGTLIANGVGEEVYVPAGHTYTPGGDVSATSIKILGTVNGGTNTFTITENWNSTPGDWNADSSTVILTGTGNLLQNTSATPWAHGFNNLTVAAAGQTTTMSSVIWSNQITTGSGVLTDAASSHSLTLTGTGNVFVDGGATLRF